MSSFTQTLSLVMPLFMSHCLLSWVLLFHCPHWPRKFSSLFKKLFYVLLANSLFISKIQISIEFKQLGCYEYRPRLDSNSFKYATATAAKLLQSCPTLCNPIDRSPPGSPSLWFSRQEHWTGLPFPLQCMKVKNECDIDQPCLTRSSLLGSAIHGIFQARAMEWGAIAFSV